MPRKKTTPELPKEEKAEKIEEIVVGTVDGEDKMPDVVLDGVSGESVPPDQGGAECAAADLNVAELSGEDAGPEDGSGLGTAEATAAVSEAPAADVAEADPVPTDEQELTALEFRLVDGPTPADTAVNEDGSPAPLDGDAGPDGDAPLDWKDDAIPDAEDAPGGSSGAVPEDDAPPLGDSTQIEEDGPSDDDNMAGTGAVGGGDGHDSDSENNAASPRAGTGEADLTGSEDNAVEITGSEEGTPAPKRKQTKKAGTDASEKTPVKHKTAAADRTPVVAQPKVSLRSQNVRAQDRDLTPEEKKEWDAIYASYTSKSILTGVVQGVDMNTFTIRNADGLLETKKMASAVIISHRVKVLVPELEFSMPDKLLPESVVHHLDQCSIDYVIISVDRENNLAIASRRLAMSARRRYFRTAPRGHERGEELTCRILSVGPTRCTVECNGYDQEMRASDMGYNYIEDLREQFRPGDELRCRLVSFSAKDGLKVSVKEAQRHPFDGAVERHPIGCTRHATITNKDSGAIFCLLSDSVSCVCRYAAQLNDTDFEIGDTVVIVVDSYYLEGQMLRGKILKKW